MGTRATRLFPNQRQKMTQTTTRRSWSSMIIAIFKIILWVVTSSTTTIGCQATVTKAHPWLNLNLIRNQLRIGTQQVQGATTNKKNFLKSDDDMWRNWNDFSFDHEMQMTYNFSIILKCWVLLMCFTSKSMPHQLLWPCFSLVLLLSHPKYCDVVSCSKNFLWRIPSSVGFKPRLNIFEVLYKWMETETFSHFDVLITAATCLTLFLYIPAQSLTN